MFEALRNREADYSCPDWRTVSSSAKDLLHRMLLKDPAKRISAENVLRHPWIKHLAPATASSHDASVNWTDSSTRSGPSKSTGSGSEAEGSEWYPSSMRRSDLDSAGADDFTTPGASEDGLGSSGSTPGHSSRGRGVNRNASTRVFYTPQSLRPRLLLHGFVDTFKSQVRPCCDASG